MNFHDPLRAKLANGMPTYASEKIIAVLPTFTVANSKPGHIRLMAFLPSGYNRFAPKYVEMTHDELSGFLARFELDPEGTLETTFAWSLQEAEEAASKGNQTSITGSSRPKEPPAGKTESSADELGF